MFPTSRLECVHEGKIMEGLSTAYLDAWSLDARNEEHASVLRRQEFARKAAFLLESASARRTPTGNVSMVEKKMVQAARALEKLGYTKWVGKQDELMRAMLNGEDIAYAGGTGDPPPSVTPSGI